MIAGGPNGLAQTDRPFESDSIYLLSALTSNSLMWTFPADLHQFGLINGQLLSTTHIADGGDDGIYFVAADYPGRAIVLASPRGVPTNFSVIDMDQPSSIRQVTIGDTYGDGEGATFRPFVERPGHALELALEIRKRTEYRLLGVPLSGEAKPETLHEDVMKYARSSGYFGTAFDDTNDLYVASKPASNLSLRFEHGDVDLGIPSAQLKTQVGPIYLVVKNDAAIVISSFPERTESQDGPGESIYHIYSMAGHAWNTLAVPGARTTVRSFGRWLAFVVSDAQPWTVKAKGARYVEFDAGKHRVSPGRAERMQNELKVDKYRTFSVDDAFLSSDQWFPGILLLYDVQTGKSYRLETDQGDSEVVLVEGSDVYYRVNTTLYRAKIGNTALESITEVAKNPAIGNVHWAFIPRKAAQ